MIAISFEGNNNVPTILEELFISNKFIVGNIKITIIIVTVK